MCSWLCEESSRAGDAGCNLVDRVDPTGSSALHLAARRGSVEAVAVLLHNGASVELKVSVSFISLEDGTVNGFCYRMTWA